MRIEEARARKRALRSGGRPGVQRPSEELPSGEVPSEEIPSGELPSGELPSAGESPGDVSRAGGALAESTRLVSAFDAPAPSFVGIVPSSDPDGFRLAVRYTDPVDEAELARVRAFAGEDADVRVVGPIRALSSAPADISGVSSAGSVSPAEGGDEPATGPVAAEPVPEPPEGFVAPTPEELQQRVRPLVRGLSVAHRDVTAGTIGAFVTVADSVATHVLSNNHVLGDSDRGKPGDDVLQPGPADGGTVDDRIGELLVAVRLKPSAANVVDCALAVLDADVEVDPAAHDGAITGVIAPVDVVGNVAKIGRTTGLTIGRITAIEVDGVQVGYDTGVFTFDDQVEIEGVDGGFSAGGDSGSVIYTEVDRQGVGLLFAGSTSGGSGGTGVTYANPLGEVLAALEATLIGAVGDVTAGDQSG